MIDRLIAGKGLSKDYKRGLEAAQKEFLIEEIGKKIDAIPKTPAKDLRTDEHFQKGFNIGYRLAENHGYALNVPQTVNKEYSTFLEGVKMGKQQYEYDLAELHEKDPNGRIFPEDPHTSQYQKALFDQKLATISDVTKGQINAMERNKAFTDVPAPKWLQKKETRKEATGPGKNKNKSKNKGTDMDR
jgi:hypothetical protein